MRDPLTNCSYNQVYKNLKEFSQNGENFCKQVTSILQQRANLEFNYAKGLQKLAIKLTKALQSTKKNCTVSAWAWVSEGMKSAADLHQKLGKAIELEAIKPTDQVLSVHEKKRKSLDNEVEKTANLCINNWNQQMKAKKKLMVSTKKHEALFHLVESTKQTMTEREKQKLLNKLKKSTEKLAKEDENYYQKNIAGCSTRLKWENTLENCYQVTHGIYLYAFWTKKAWQKCRHQITFLSWESPAPQFGYNVIKRHKRDSSLRLSLCMSSILELEKERIQLLCNNLNQYTQHISVFGQTLTTCHAQIHCAISKIDVEKDIQALVEETAISSTENKSEFLLTDYFEEDLNNAMNKERQESSIKSKLSRLQRDIEKTSRDREGLERMLKAYSNHSSFSDPESQKNTAALMDETNVKLDLLQANSYKLLSVLAELKQRPQPSHSCSNSIFKWKEKQQTHSYVKLSRPFLMKRSENVVSREPSGEQNNPNSPSTASSVAQHGNNLCKALYPFQARQDDELNLEKGDIVTLHQKKGEGWWFGSLKGKKGHFPAAYVEELPSNAGDTGIRQGSQRATLHTL
ncbi:PREDICTED: nostrin isoform X9 [Hipposideros armiger]|uniref:Nostrin n=1 Tax=Hipposideros armiger TaxID=186990 RepID=A0A8B7SJN3_HIPAR|nr:PREDICTED: nostrin isoform X9 [Hipposideros armiger]